MALLVGWPASGPTHTKRQRAGAQDRAPGRWGPSGGKDPWPLSDSRNRCTERLTPPDAVSPAGQRRGFADGGPQETHRAVGEDDVAPPAVDRWNCRTSRVPLLCCNHGTRPVEGAVHPAWPLPHNKFREGPGGASQQGFATGLRPCHVRPGRAFRHQDSSGRCRVPKCPFRRDVPLAGRKTPCNSHKMVRRGSTGTMGVSIRTRRQVRIDSIDCRQ